MWLQFAFVVIMRQLERRRPVDDRADGFAMTTSSFLGKAHWESRHQLRMDAFVLPKNAVEREFAQIASWRGDIAGWFGGERFHLVNEGERFEPCA